MANTKKKRDQKIRKLKKIHIVPYVVCFVCFSWLFTVMMTLVMGLFITYMSDNALQRYEEDSIAFVKEFEELNPGPLEKDKIVVPDIGKEVNFLIFDSQDKNLYGDAMSPTENMFIYGAEEAFSDGNNIITPNYYIEMDLDLGIKNSMDVSRYHKLIGDFINNNLHKEISSGWDREEAVRLNAWRVCPIQQGNYTIYYNTPIVFTNRDLASLIAMIAFGAMASMIPMVMFLISFISGIVEQTKGRRILFYDTITENNNWTWFQVYAPRVFRRAKRRNLKVKVIDIHMDKYQDFCLFNGAEEGEELLARLYRTIRRNLRKYEIFARNTEADFGWIMIEADPDACNARLHDLMQQLEQCGYGQKITFSIGVCEAESGNQDIDQLYSNASVSRKSIASDAKERISWFNEKFKADQLWEHKVEQTMEKALQNGEFQVYLQPKYNAVTHELGGAEALIRWISPTEGFIGPGRFIPIFEKNGFITKIDDFMLHSVATLQAKWAEEGKNVVPVSVNVSRVHFTQEDLADHIEQIIAETGVDRNLIELELTESAFFEDKTMLINTVEALKGKGFAISMDDFGAGYSSLNSLKELPIDVLKLDAEFFRGKEKNGEKGEVIVLEALHLAKSLGMKTVAEGIEVAEQVEFLANNGCDLIQGFYFAKPMPIADYEARMEMKFPPEE